MLRTSVSMFISELHFFLPVCCLIYFFCFCSVYCWKHFLFCNNIWLLSRFGQLEALVVDLKVGQRKTQEHLGPNSSGQWWLQLFSGSISYHTSLCLWFPDPTRDLTTIVPVTTACPLILGSSHITFCL